MASLTSATRMFASASRTSFARPAQVPAASLLRSTFRAQPYSTQPTHSDTSAAADAKNKNAVGPFTLRAAVVFALTGAGLYAYFESEKRAVAARKAAETATAKIGRPKIGGPFVLEDQNGNEFTEKNLVGQFSLVYFGFTNCPDICPEELDKMGLVVEDIAKDYKVDILPVFITCDPARDDTKSVKTYVKDFHPNLVGLTGTYDAIKRCCKAYRVYFSTPPNASASDDYLVDHSIFFYLMDPNGEFVDAFGRSMGPEETTKKVAKYICDWHRAGGRAIWKDTQI